MNNNDIDINNIESRIEYVEESHYFTEDDMKKNDKIIVHKGKSNAKSVDDIGEEISETVKTALRKTKCKYGIVENIHIEASRAEQLDGLYRICHIKDDKEHKRIILKEYHDTKVAFYSSLFYVLRSELKERRIEQNSNNGKIYIDYNKLAEFVEALNEVNSKLDNGYYKLCKFGTNKFNNGNLFHVVYWKNKK